MAALAAGASEESSIPLPVPALTNPTVIGEPVALLDLPSTDALVDVLDVPLLLPEALPPEELLQAATPKSPAATIAAPTARRRLTGFQVILDPLDRAKRELIVDMGAVALE